MKARYKEKIIKDISNAIKSLRDIEQKILILYVAESLTFAEIASVLEREKIEIKNIFNQAMNTLTKRTQSHAHPVY